MWAGSRPDGLVAVKVRCVRAVRRSLHATPASARACCRPKRACWLARAPWHLAGLHDVQKTLQLHDLLRKHSEHGMSALPMQMSACPWNAQHSRPGGWCGLQPARGRLSRSAVKACVQSTYVRHAGVPARVQVQYPDALARMQQDLVNIRIAARFLQARPSPNLTRLSLNSRGSALCRSRHLLVTLSRPARRRVRGPRTAAPGTRPAPDSGRARAAAGDGAPIDLVSAVDELAAQLQTEFDFRREAETMDLIHARLKARCPPTPRPNPLHTQSLLAHAPVRCQGAGVRACAGRGRGLPARREGDQAR